MKKVLAIASGGGHWKQLILISKAFEGCDTRFVTTIEGLPEEEGIKKYNIVRDSNLNEKINLLITFFQVLKIVVTFRPNVIVTTGAAPGLLAIMVGRLLMIKTVWIDSIANGEELSLGGKISKKIAHHVFTQWEHLADGENVKHEGSVF